MNKLKEVVQENGGVTSFARIIEERPNTISMWFQRGYVPATKVIPMCKRLHFSVRPHDIRADIYPHPDDGMPKEGNFQQ